MKMSRETCVRIIKRMVEALEAGNVPVSCNALYAGGQFAQGMTVCAELDVVVMYAERTLDEFLPPGAHKWQERKEAALRLEAELMRALVQPDERVQLWATTDFEAPIARKFLAAERYRMVWDGDPNWRDSFFAIANPRILNPLRFNVFEIMELETQIEAGTITMRRFDLSALDPVLIPAFQNLGHGLPRGLDGQSYRYAVWWMQQAGVQPNMIEEPRRSHRFYQNMMLSADGRCRVYFGRPSLLAAMEQVVGGDVPNKVCLLPKIVPDERNEMIELSTGTTLTSLEEDAILDGVYRHANPGK